MSSENREHGESLIRKLFVCHAAFDAFHHCARDSESHAPAFAARVFVAGDLHAGFICEESLYGVCGVMPKGRDLCNGECFLLAIVDERLILRGLSFSRFAMEPRQSRQRCTRAAPNADLCFAWLDYIPRMASGLRWGFRLFPSRASDNTVLLLNNRPTSTYG